MLCALLFSRLPFFLFAVLHDYPVYYLYSPQVHPYQPTTHPFNIAIKYNPSSYTPAVLRPRHPPTPTPAHAHAALLIFTPTTLTTAHDRHDTRQYPMFSGPKHGAATVPPRRIDMCAPHTPMTMNTHLPRHPTPVYNALYAPEACVGPRRAVDPSERHVRGDRTDMRKEKRLESVFYYTI